MYRTLRSYSWGFDEDVTSGHRHTSRVVLLDRDRHFLLFLTRAPDTSGVSRWITPGGGVDPGESNSQAAIRELFEETGLRVDTVGEPIWAHDFDVQWDAADHSSGHATFYTVMVDRFDPSSLHWTAQEQIDVIASRWWSADELLTSEEPFEPAELPTVVANALRIHSGGTSGIIESISDKG
ncbi:MAG: NUDIX hydrolase [Microbacteriaceae bacterium]